MDWTSGSSNRQPPLFYNRKEPITTSECTRRDLRLARESANLPREAASELLGVSPSTLRRWEDPNPQNGVDPSPEDVKHMEQVYHADGLSYRWMRATIEPLQELLPPLQKIDLPAALMQFYVEHSDLNEHKRSAMRDAIDGKIDNECLLEILIKELEDVISAAFTLRMLLLKQRK